MRLLLLPGMDGTGRLFGPLLEALPAAIKPVVVSYPCDQPCGYEELLPLVEQAIPDDEEFLILGESFSGPLALLCAAQKPRGLRGVILCASFVRSPLPFPTHWLRRLVHPGLFRMAPRWLIRRRLLGRHASGSLGTALDTALAQVSPAVFAARAKAILRVDATAALKSCEVPLLYLTATEDRLVRQRSLTAIQRLRPEVETAFLPGPHLVLQTAPQEAAMAIMKFAMSGAPITSKAERNTHLRQLTLIQKPLVLMSDN